MQNQVVANILIESSVNTTSLESLTKGYVLNCRTEGKSPKTLLGYQMVLRNFVWYCQQNNFPDVQRLTTVHIRHFLWYLGAPNRWDACSHSTRTPASQTTVNGYYRALRTFFNWLEREELILDNPFRHLKAPKTDTKAVQALTNNEIDRLFQLCKEKSMLDIRNKAILSLFLDCGLRVSELSGLSLDDVNLDNASLLINGKGRKQRVVRMGAKTQKALWRYLTIYRRGESGASGPLRACYS